MEPQSGDVEGASPGVRYRLPGTVRGRLGFFVLWVVATAAGGVLGLFLGSSTSFALQSTFAAAGQAVAAASGVARGSRGYTNLSSAVFQLLLAGWIGLLVGLFQGGGQWLVLRRAVRPALMWVAATVLGWVVAQMLSMLVAFQTEPAAARLVVALVIGVLVGGAQAGVLGRWVRGSALWVLAVALDSYALVALGGGPAPADPFSGVRTLPFLLPTGVVTGATLLALMAFTAHGEVRVGGPGRPRLLTTWAAWVVAGALGAALFAAAANVLSPGSYNNVVMLPFVGACFAVAQAAAVRRVAPVGWWVVATAGAGVVAGVVTLALSVGLDMRGRVGEQVVAFALQFAILSAGQWLLLRRFGPRAAAWVGAGLVGGALYAWASRLTGDALGAAARPVLGLAAGAVLSLPGGALSGAVMGAVLVWILRGLRTAQAYTGGGPAASRASVNDPTAATSASGSAP